MGYMYFICFVRVSYVVRAKDAPKTQIKYIEKRNVKDVGHEWKRHSSLSGVPLFSQFALLLDPPPVCLHIVLLAFYSVQSMFFLLFS